jgi:hypothetical protein
MGKQEVSSGRKERKNNKWRKRKNMVQISFHISKELSRKLQREVEKSGKTMSEVCRERLERGYEKIKLENGAIKTMAITMYGVNAFIIHGLLFGWIL